MSRIRSWDIWIWTLHSSKDVYRNMLKMIQCSVVTLFPVYVPCSFLFFFLGSSIILNKYPPTTWKVPECCLCMHSILIYFFIIIVCLCFLVGSYFVAARLLWLKPKYEFWDGICGRGGPRASSPNASAKVNSTCPPLSPEMPDGGLKLCPVTPSPIELQL